MRWITQPQTDQDELITEARGASCGIDRLSSQELVELMNRRGRSLSRSAVRLAAPVQVERDDRRDRRAAWRSGGRLRVRGRRVVGRGSRRSTRPSAQTTFAHPERTRSAALVAGAGLAAEPQSGDAAEDDYRGGRAQTSCSPTVSAGRRRAWAVSASGRDAVRHRALVEAAAAGRRARRARCGLHAPGSAAGRARRPRRSRSSVGPELISPAPRG